MLYQVLAEHLDSFLEQTEGDGHRRSLPRFVERELRGYLHFGLLASDFARVYCPACRREELVAFACCLQRATMRS